MAKAIERLEYDRAHFAERFEYYVGCCAPRESLLTTFAWPKERMEEECVSAFGMGFYDSYAYFLSIAINEARQAVASLAGEGNGAALKIAAESIWKLGEDGAKKERTVQLVLGRIEE